MKTSNRENTILFFLLAILLAYGFYVICLTPQLEKGRELETQVAAGDTVIREMYTTIAECKQKLDQLKETADSVQALSNNFYVYTEQEQYLNQLTAMLTESGLVLLNIDALENIPLEPDVEGYRCENPFAIYQVPSSADSNVDESAILPVVEKMEIKVDATGPYSGIKKFLTLLRTYEKQIYCNELSIEVSAESLAAAPPDSEVRIIVTLSFLRLNKLSGFFTESSLPSTEFDYMLPIEFTSGSYRNLYSLSNWTAVIQRLFTNDLSEIEGVQS